MRKTIRQSLPEIIFFCAAFITVSAIFRSQYALISGMLGSFFLKFGLHFASWSGSRRSCAVLFSVIFITVLIFLAARYTCGIQKNSGKGKLISISIPVIISFFLIAVMCELQIFRRDDFWEVQYSRDLGLIGFMGYVFRIEGGRYFSYFLKGCNAFFPTVQASMIYMNTCLFLSLLTMLMGIYRLVMFLFKTSASADRSVSEKKLSFFTAFALFSAVIFTSPKIWENWFWDAAGLIYGIGISLSVWTLALVMADILYNTDQRKKVILPTLILIFACGCSQITTIAIDILITEFLLYAFLSRRNTINRRRVLYYFLITLAASAICLLAPGNFYRLEKAPFEFMGFSEAWHSLSQLVIRLWQQIWVNIIMMKKYWLLLIIISFFFGLLISLRNRRKIILLAIGMLPAGFFSLSLNCMLDYMPARIYAAAFIWIAIPAALLSITAGSSLRDLLKDPVLPAGIQSAWVFLAVLALSCPFIFLFCENYHLLQDIRSAWFYRDEQIRSEPLSPDQTIRICGVPVIETNGTDIRLAEKFIANYYGVYWVEDSGVCPPFTPVSDDPALYR